MKKSLVETNTLLSPHVVTGAVAKYFSAISESPCKDAIADFKDRFEKQMIEKGKMGRASDEIRGAAKEVILKGAKSMPPPFDKVVMSSEGAFSDMVNAALWPQLWGSTSSWEVSAAEPGYLGSLRLNLEGTRVVAITKMLDGIRFLKSQHGSSSSSALDSKSLNLDAVLKWFRNLDKDCALHIKSCFR